MWKTTKTRPSAIAGRWYPENAEQLKQELQQYLALADPANIPGTLLALIVPHAGYVYSGQTAAYAFQLLRDQRFERVIVSSPFHAMTYESLLTSEFASYETPLGAIRVDQPALQRIDEHLQSQGSEKIFRIRQEQEHSLEIELPFLQIVLEEPFDLVPLMVRTHQPALLRTLAEGLIPLLKEKPTLLVASTDLSHFHAAEQAEKMDAIILADIENLDAAQLLQDNHTGKGAACGAGAVALTLLAAKLMGADKARILHYSHSGDVTGDHDSVVGYGAAAIYRQEG